MSITTRRERRTRCSHCQHRACLWGRVQTVQCPYCAPDIPMMNKDTSALLPVGAGNNSSRCRRIESLCNHIRRIVSPGRSGVGAAPGKMPVTEGGSGTRLSKARARKRAVLCGVTYTKRRHRLKGTINDVRSMKQLLTAKFGFLEDNIRILTEEEKDQGRIPTRKNIRQALEWLVRDCQPGDSLVFFFSGHGVRQPESVKGDEVDGFDETICPVDFMTEGMIIDNEINSTLVQPLPKGVTLHAIVDSCHSGTILDLPYVYDYKEGKWMDNRPPSGAFKGTAGGFAISLSACSDEEIASDTSVLTGKTMCGAMTYSFVQAITRKPELTYRELLRSMHEGIEEANTKPTCLNSSILSRLFPFKLLQEPMLSSSEMFDINRKLFKL